MVGIDQSDNIPQVTESKGQGALDSSIRVDVSLLDKLMNMVGELVLTRNQIRQGLTKREDPSLLRASQRLSLITTELQEGIMKTRMQQIGNIWGKFPRVVRDLALSCGKEVRLEMEGKETELDKTLLEAIKDPLMHLVRNSVDHGIEVPHIREKGGKPREGLLLLRAYHEDGQVVIEVTDDGEGIDVQGVVNTAIRKGLVTAEKVSSMAERELLELIFLPGFSTAETVTTVSGRGVGMNVVKNNIEKIGGTIDITMEPGGGSTFKLKVPLTLAIIPALIVTSNGERYAIPQGDLLEVIRVDGEAGSPNIEWIHSAPIYRSRGQLLPLFYLNKIMGGEQSVPGMGHPVDIPKVENIVVLQADARRFGLVVEKVKDTEEIVVKPLSDHFKDIPIYAGATIMGDGKVALIFDVAGLAQQAKLQDRKFDSINFEGVSETSHGGPTFQPLLLVQVGTKRRMGIPVSQIARLEKMIGMIKETAGGQEVVQYRGTILPVLHLHDLLPSSGYASEQQSETFNLVVVKHGGRQVGIIVDRIMDIVDVTVGQMTRSDQLGLSGSVVIQGRVTDVLDVEAVLENRTLLELRVEEFESIGV